MTQTYRLDLVVRGGVRGLARVIDVLALLELTPDVLHSVRMEDGVAIQLQFTSDARRAALCRARLLQLVVVRDLSDADVPPVQDLTKRRILTT